MSRWKFTPSISSQFFFNESTYLLIKFLALISSFLYLYGIQFFPCLHNFVEGIKYICQVYTFINQEGLVMTRLKEPGRSGNYLLWNSTWPRLWISSQRGGIFWNYFVEVQPKQRMFRITWWRSSGIPIEKIRTIWTNFARLICINAFRFGNQRKQLP